MDRSICKTQPAGAVANSCESPPSLTETLCIPSVASVPAILQVSGVHGAASSGKEEAIAVSFIIQEQR